MRPRAAGCACEPWVWLLARDSFATTYLGGSQKVNRIMIGVTIVSVFAASVVALGIPAQAPASAHATHRAAPEVTTIKVTAKDFKFILSKKTATRGIVTFKVTNTGATPTRLQHQGPHDEEALTRPVGDSAGHLPAQGPLSVQMHSRPPRRVRHEGRLHDHLGNAGGHEGQPCSRLRLAQARRGEGRPSLRRCAGAAMARMRERMTVVDLCAPTRVWLRCSPGPEFGSHGGGSEPAFSWLRTAFGRLPGGSRSSAITPMA